MAVLNNKYCQPLFQSYVFSKYGFFEYLSTAPNYLDRTTTPAKCSPLLFSDSCILLAVYSDSSSLLSDSILLGSVQWSIISLVWQYLVSSVQWSIISLVWQYLLLREWAGLDSNERLLTAVQLFAIVKQFTQVLWRNDWVKGFASLDYQWSCLLSAMSLKMIIFFILIKKKFSFSYYSSALWLLVLVIIK